MKETPTNTNISRGTAVALGWVVWLIVIPLFHAGLPWMLGGLDTRHGWVGGWPGALNWLGLAPVAGGASLLAWVMRTGLAQVKELPERLPLGWSPVCFMENGPYAISRNPMYFSYVVIWHGWAVFYGSHQVLGMTLLIWVSLQLVVIPREEHDLEKAFGAAYLAYKAQVCRWLGQTPAPPP